MVPNVPYATVRAFVVALLRNASMRHNLVCETFCAESGTMPMMQFASRLDSIETSAIRELFKVLGKPGIISFAGGFPDPTLFDVEGIRLAAEQALLNGQAATSLQYGATEGLPLLRELLAEHMTAKEMPVSAHQTVVTTGCQQALDSVAKCLIDPGDKVLVEAPTFLAAIQCFRIYGADVRGVPTDAHGIDVDALERAMAEHRPKMLYLIPNFGNPAGALLTLERRRRIVSLAAEYQTVVVEDDPYGELYFDTPPPPTLYALAMAAGVADRFVYCGSLSKVLAPGLRVGWLTAHADLLSRAVMCKQFTDAHTSNLSQMAAALYLQSGRLPQAVHAMRTAYAARAKTLAAALRSTLGERLSFTTPQGGMFLWARMRQEQVSRTPDTPPALSDAGKWAQRAIARGAAFVPGAPFFAEQPQHDTLRLSYATASEADISEGVQRLQASWQQEQTSSRSSKGSDAPPHDTA